jgi:hypothetical protein
MSNKREPGTHHVVPNPQGGWDVRRGGADRAAGHFDHKTDAVDRGREISRNAGTELKIHNRDGRIGLNRPGFVGVDGPTALLVPR